MLTESELLEILTEALHATRRGAPTRPVSVTLPGPLADAYRLLADQEVIASVSEATVRALEDTLQAIVVGLRLDAIYAEHPDARPTEAQVHALAQRAGIEL